jgi:hypothetical protein
MVVEEDHSSSSSTQLPSQHVLRYRGRRELEEDQLGQQGVECSTVTDTPLPNHRQFTLSSLAPIHTFFALLLKGLWHLVIAWRPKAME